MHIELTFPLVNAYLLGLSALGLIFGLYNWFFITSINLDEDLTNVQGRKSIEQSQLNEMKLTAARIEDVKTKF